MASANDHRLEELFVRYWDNALSATEVEELQKRLAADPTARAWFQDLCLQVLVVAETPAVAGLAPTIPLPARRPLWSRRRMLAAVGTALAASVAGGVLGWHFWPRQLPHQVRLAIARGRVTLRSAEGQLIPVTGVVPRWGILATHGPGSSAVLSYPDGTDIHITGDSLVRVADEGRWLLLLQGTATATVLQRSPESPPLTLSTTEATVSRLSGVAMTLGRLRQGTEVGVHRGQVSVSAPTGEPLEVVHGGELLTVHTDGGRRKQTLRDTPDAFAWDLTRPLPDGWHVGQREETPTGAVVRPEFWFDPYHQAEMSQIRSDKQWSRGFFRLFPDSVFRVRYWVDRPGPSQLVVCVRTERVSEPLTGVVEYNGAFARARPRQWQWLEVKAADMLDNIHAPQFAAPWVGFLVVFNTYKVDLGLKIAEFRVSRPERPPGVPGQVS